MQNWTLQLLAVPGGDESDADDEDMDAEIDGAAPTATRIKKVQEAYKHPDALTAMYITVKILGKISQLIVDSSGLSVPSNLYERLSLLGMKLENSSKMDTATLVTV